ncbi:uncharacterized protein LOC123545803 [Mercenaria mercenaria]|uniref:uncharacterized protein LOC123545803 n=1 Tax=Mercenaria mercenaria TaxID=6596 RepID=UPI00234F7991|nr:uncharacterized protein LOC123545803 [Mercenaria mercenaria]
MFSQNLSLIFFIAATLIAECYGYKTIVKQRISKGKVNGEMMQYCEYKLLKMMPKSKVLDPDACLSCKCNNKFLICKDAKYIPGCKLMPGGQMTQNPFDKEWKKLVDPLIKPEYTDYRILQVRTQVVAGRNIYMWLHVDNALLCDLTVFEDLNGGKEITKDTCGLKK